MELRRPANPHEDIVGTVQGELVHTPRLMARAFFLDDFASKGGSSPVDVLAMEVQAERIALRIKPALGSLRQVKAASKPII